MDSMCHKEDNSMGNHRQNGSQSRDAEEQDKADNSAQRLYNDDGSLVRGHGSEYELRKLSFKNPGKSMEDLKPKKSVRELRKMNRKSYKEKTLKNQLYDECGVLLHNKKDLCDCLVTSCPGCHFPCPKCGSEKCGTECRCNRKWVFEDVHVEGTKIIFKWPT